MVFLDQQYPLPPSSQGKYSTCTIEYNGVGDIRPNNNGRILHNSTTYDSPAAISFSPSSHDPPKIQKASRQEHLQQQQQLPYNHRHREILMIVVGREKSKTEFVVSVTCCIMIGGCTFQFNYGSTPILFRINNIEFRLSRLVSVYAVCFFIYDFNLFRKIRQILWFL
jgi:hypothetical protein